MAGVFTVLAQGHGEVKDMLAEMEQGPAQAAEASQDRLAKFTGAARKHIEFERHLCSRALARLRQTRRATR